MPAKEIDYSKTIIYKIVCNDLAITDLYVGSTTHFTRRKNGHKSRCNCSTKKAEYKIYQTIRDNGGWLNWSMLQIEEFPCANGNEARARERYWYEQLNANLNTGCPNRSRSEWRELNKEHIKCIVKANYEENRDTYLEYGKKYRDEHKEQIKINNKDYYNENKEQVLMGQKMYYEENKTQIAEKNKIRYELNKDKILEYKRMHGKRPYNCDCGSICRISEKSRHFKSLKHQNYIKSLTVEV
jgi:hypothetical protein